MLLYRVTVLWLFVNAEVEIERHNRNAVSSLQDLLHVRFDVNCACHVAFLLAVQFTEKNPLESQIKRSPPIRDSKGTKTFVYHRRILLQEG